MKRIIRLTESELKNIINKSVLRILKEDGEIGGGGATNCVGVNVGGALGQNKNHIDMPAFTNKPIRKKNNLGSSTSKKTDTVDIEPALDRTPGFSVGEKKK